MRKRVFDILLRAWLAVCCDPTRMGFARFVDSYKSGCEYCWNARSMVIGAAVPMIWIYWPAAICMVAVVYLLHWGERAFYGDD